MRKVVYTNPRVIQACYDCPFASMEWQGFWGLRGNLFCTLLYAPIEDVRDEHGKGYPILRPMPFSAHTHIYIKDIYSIPEFCPLETYKEIE